VPVDKFSISLPTDLVAELDEIALSEGSTRSAVIREAASEYVAARTSAESERSRKRRVATAMAGFDAIADDWGADSTTSLEYLLEIRGERGEETTGSESPPPPAGPTSTVPTSPAGRR
jgi:predicted transcriptional regulator